MNYCTFTNVDEALTNEIPNKNQIEFRQLIRLQFLILKTKQEG
jgi:hypothetical protein